MQILIKPHYMPNEIELGMLFMVIFKARNILSLLKFFFLLVSSNQPFFSLTKLRSSAYTPGWAPFGGRSLPLWTFALSPGTLQSQAPEVDSDPNHCSSGLTRI